MAYVNMKSENGETCKVNELIMYYYWWCCCFLGLYYHRLIIYVLRLCCGPAKWCKYLLRVEFNQVQLMAGFVIQTKLAMGLTFDHRSQETSLYHCITNSRPVHLWSHNHTWLRLSMSMLNSTKKLNKYALTVNVLYINFTEKKNLIRNVVRPGIVGECI